MGVASWSSLSITSFPQSGLLKCQKNLTSERGRKYGARERKVCSRLTTFRLVTTAVGSSRREWAVYLSLSLQEKHLPITCGVSRTLECTWTVSGDRSFVGQSWVHISLIKLLSNVNDILKPKWQCSIVEREQSLKSNLITQNIALQLISCVTLEWNYLPFRHCYYEN